MYDHGKSASWSVLTLMLVNGRAAQVQGWSPERSVRFGAAMLNAILAVLPDLR